MANERWNFGGSAEFGTLLDAQTGAETDRRAAGVRVGYGLDRMQFSSAVEYRRDDAEQLDLRTRKGPPGCSVTTSSSS